MNISVDIDVMELKIKPTRRRVATLLVKYGALMMNCDLVIHHKTHTLWVRMPEVWFVPDKKTQFCFWPTKELSDHFQKIVLGIIFEKYGINLDIALKIHHEFSGKSKNPRQNQNK